MSSSEAGVIFASINFENKAGITQSYMITNEIIIDLIDFIYPAEITLNQFRALWQKYEWENRILINTNIADSLQYIQHIATILKMKILSSIDSEQDNSFLSVNLYAKTTLNDDFLMNISIDKCSSKIQGYLRVRSKTKGIVINLGERIRKLQNI